MYSARRDAGNTAVQDSTSELAAGRVLQLPGDDAGLRALRELALRAGKDPLLTQASSGNCSLKAGDVLWIKASGQWMSDAHGRDFLVPLSLGAVREAVVQGLEPADYFSGASLETALHAVMPHRMILHLHSVNAISWAVLADGAERVTEALGRVPWMWIPYMPSGLALGNAIRDALDRRPDAQLFILGNHGVVIGADDEWGLQSIVDEAERRLAVVPRPLQRADPAWLSRLSAGTPWNVPEPEALHAVAMDEAAREILARGFLVPSQAMLTGDRNSDRFRAVPDTCAETAIASASASTMFLIIEGRGVLIRQCATPAYAALLSGLVEVARRISPSAPVRYLTGQEIVELDSPRYQNYRTTAYSK